MLRVCFASLEYLSATIEACGERSSILRSLMPPFGVTPGSLPEVRSALLARLGLA